MAFQKTSILVSKTGNTYNTAEEWISEHGTCGITNEEVSFGEIIADGTDTVKRVLQFETEEIGQAFANTIKQRSSDERTWTTTHQHTGLIEV